LARYFRTEKWSLLTSAATGIAWNLFRASDAWLLAIVVLVLFPYFLDYVTARKTWGRGSTYYMGFKPFVSLGRNMAPAVPEIRT